MYRVFNMGHRMEFYLPEEYAESVIKISKDFNVEAQIIGRCETSVQKSLTIVSESGTYSYL
jgi:phosphoribosylformylglycinamidine cyclo-ligase